MWKHERYQDTALPCPYNINHRRRDTALPCPLKAEI